jgi:Rrf2 family cysteine metabolism transcriptional repressor
MRISTRGRYALRAMLDLALHDDAGPVLRQDIATRQEISADYVAQLFQHLCAVGLAKGVKGPGGGYLLARDPAAIRVGDVVRAVEGPIAAADCVTPGSLPVCHRAEACATRLLWARLSEAIAQFLDAISLKELCDQARQLNPGGAANQHNTVETLAEMAGRLPSFDGRCKEAPRANRQPSAAGAYTYEI